MITFKCGEAVKGWASSVTSAENRIVWRRETETLMLTRSVPTLFARQTPTQVQYHAYTARDLRKRLTRDALTCGARRPITRRLESWLACWLIMAQHLRSTSTRALPPAMAGRASPSSETGLAMSANIG